MIISAVNAFGIEYVLMPANVDSIEIDQAKWGKHIWKWRTIWCRIQILYWRKAWLMRIEAHVAVVGNGKTIKKSFVHFILLLFIFLIRFRC